MWYFGGHGSDTGEESAKAGVCIATCWAFRYHLGSLAWGAFLVAVITMIRVIFEYIVYQYEKAGMKDNIIFKCVACYIRCILKCLDMCIKFINKNAYIQVALHNRSFCEGARESFYLMARNAARFNAVGWTGAILLFIGKILVTTACVFLTIVLIDA
jgi:choline transporter-like protein 2/4/5